MEKYRQGGVVAATILQQLGGVMKLNLFTGAYNFVDLGNGVSFRIKNQRANFIKITVNSLDLYDLEVGRIRGMDYKVVAEEHGLYNDMLKPAIERITGMYLSFKNGGTLPKEKSLLYFVLNHASSGMIATRTKYSMYKDIDGVRQAAIHILNREGDREYSISNFNDLIQEAVLEYDENKSGHLAAGGIMEKGGNVSKGKRWRRDWSTSSGDKGYDIYEIVNTKSYSTNYNGGWVVLSKIVESSDSSRLGRIDENHLDYMKEVFKGKYPFSYKLAAGGAITADGVTIEQWRNLGLNIVGGGVGYSAKVKGGTNAAGDVASGEVIFEQKPMFFSKNWNPYGKFVYIDKNDEEYTSREVPSSLLGNKNKFAEGGSIALQNKQMVAVKAKEIQHHAEEIMEALEGNEEVPAWVLAKVQRSATDISDAAHYLEGVKGMFDEGGSIAAQNKQMVERKAKEIKHHAKELMEALEGNEEVPAWVVAVIERSATDISDAAHYLADMEEDNSDIVTLERGEPKYEDDIVTLERVESSEGNYGIDGFKRGGSITFSKYTDVNKPMIGDKYKSGTTNGIVYEVSPNGNEFKLKDEYGNKSNRLYHINSTAKAKISRSKEAFTKGGKVKPKEVIEEEVYIEYLNKDKGFRKDRKDFKNEKEAREWAQENFERFDPDMIKYKFAKGGAIKELQVGQVYVLPNGEEIKVEKLFTENIDAEWVGYLRDGKYSENSVKSLRQFLKNWKAQLKMAKGGSVGNKISQKTIIDYLESYDNGALHFVGEVGSDAVKFMDTNGSLGFVKTNGKMDNVNQSIASYLNSKVFNKMAMGGTTFNDKVAAIEKRLQGTKVKSKYRKEFGTIYDKKESHEAAKRIAGAMINKYNHS